MPWRNGDSFETESWHYIEAANHSGKRDGRPRLLVVHSPETPEGPDTAVDVGNFFASGNTVGSTHAGVDGSPEDDDSPHTCQYVWDSLVAHGAPGANHDGLHVEIAGRAGQSAEEWRDAYSLSSIDRAANVMAQWALKYDLPLVALSNDELRRGDAGIVTHNQVSEVYQRSDHWDPGPHFPMGELVRRAQRWKRHWLSTHPNFNKSESQPDFRVAVVAETDVDAGMSRVYGHFNRLKFLRWPLGDVRVGTAVLVGLAARRKPELEEAGVDTYVLAGDDRDATAALVSKELRAGERAADLRY